MQKIHSKIAAEHAQKQETPIPRPKPCEGWWGFLLPFFLPQINRKRRSVHVEHKVYIRPWHLT